MERRSILNARLRRGSSRRQGVRGTLGGIKAVRTVARNTRKSHPRFKGWRGAGLGWKLNHDNFMKRPYTIVIALVLFNSNLVQTAPSRRQQFHGQAITLISFRKSCK